MLACSTAPVTFAYLLRRWSASAAVLLLLGGSGLPSHAGNGVPPVDCPQSSRATLRRAAQPAAAATYAWTGLGPDANWTTSSNWQPARTQTQADDVLVFDGGVTRTPIVNVNFATSQTIGQLQILNKADVTFNLGSEHTLNIANEAAGPDFTVAAGSGLTVNAPTTTVAGLTVKLLAGATSTVAGRLVFAASLPTVGPHQLLGSGAGSVEFAAGSVFTAQPNFNGFPFGNTLALNGAVVFRGGARYEQFGGSTPFGSAAPNAVAVFEPASYFYYAGSGNNGPSLSGRTYGTLEYNAGAGIKTATGESPVTIAGDLLVNSGDVRLNLNGGVNVQGQLLVNGAGLLTFNPVNAASLQFNGRAAQVLGGSAPAAALTFGPMASLAVNNPAGVVLQRLVTLQKGLVLTSGTLTPGPAAPLVLTETATVTGGSAGSFVNGPLARRVGAVTAPVTVNFPIGQGTAYRPLALNIATQLAASTYTATQVEGNPGQLVAAPLKRVSFRRAFSVTSSETTAGNFTGTITLSFGDDDFVNVPSSPDLVIAKRDGGPGGTWNSLGRSVNTGTDSGPGRGPATGTLTSDTFSNFSDFALAATNDLSSTNTFAATNPLPVQLSAFTARRRGPRAAAVEWATASELNSAYFEVQRSPDGLQFATVATAAARGRSSQPEAYAVLDAAVPATAFYYRLRQVDADGTASYSAVVTVAAAAWAATPSPYPNPARAAVFFPAESATTYRVLSPLGQPLLRGTAPAGVARVEVQTLTPGLYFLELTTTTGRVVVKFEKE